MRKIWITLAVLCIVLFPIGFAAADDSEFGGYGANIYPLQNSAIKLEYEKLTLENLAYNKTASVEATFIFKNLGADRTITVGFPEALDFHGEEEGTPTIQDFKTFVDGEPVDVVYQPLKKRNDDYEFDRAYLWKLHFKKGGTHTVKNTYRLSPTASVMGDWSITYILKTGALWAGPIGKIDIVVKSPVRIPGLEFVPYPDEYSRFHATAWEPDRNIVVKSFIQYDLALQNKGVLTDDYSGYYRDDPGKPLEIYNDASAKRRAMIREYIRHLSPETLSTATDKELQTYINGIYATYGRPFQKRNWAEFFNKKWWYQADPDYTDRRLTKEDLAAVEKMKRQLSMTN
jgi:hypothetical protein